MRIRIPMTALALAAVFALGLPAGAPGGALSPANAAGSASIPDLHHLGRLVDLRGSLSPAISSAQRLAPLPSSRRMSVTVSLRVRDQAGLNHLISELYDRNSPLYHRYLTPQQFATRFGPTRTQQDIVVKWLQSKHLRVVRRSGNGLLITARGSVANVQAAFGTRMYWYHHGSHLFFANDRPIMIPQQLSSEILAISGLSNGDRPHPQLQIRRDSTSFFTVGGYKPSDLQSLYDFTGFYQVGYSGAGQNIALFESADYSDNNIATYDNQFGISSGGVERVAVSDGNKSGASLGDGEGETEMDIELLHAIAPAAHVIVYEAPATDAGWVAMWNQIVGDNRAPVVSTSWGSPEDLTSSDTINAMHQAFQQAATQGQTILDASGDLGAYDQNGVDGLSKDQQQMLVGDYPGTDPLITVAGGTTLYGNSDGSYQSEIAWSNTDHTPPVGTGGGLSLNFQRPSWQTGPGVDNQYTNGNRQEPDVAANADADRTPYAIYSVDSHGQTGWLGAGGTSAAAPLWAAFIALINQYEGQPVGFFNPTIYALGQKASSFQYPPFHDVTQGDNLYYPATPGWDFATGWGSMDAVNFLNDMTQMGGPIASQG